MSNEKQHGGTNETYIVNESQQKSTEVNRSQQKSTEVNRSQHKSKEVHKSQNMGNKCKGVNLRFRITTVNESQCGQQKSTKVNK